MKNVGEQQDILPELTDEMVGDYLRRHPDFFIRNAQLVEQLSVPHPVRGAISLVEWHMARSRNRIDNLETGMGLLVEQAMANEGLFYRLLKLQSRLASAPDLQSFLERLTRWAKEMKLASATLRLFPDKWRIGAPSCFTHLALSRQLFEPLRVQRFGDQSHYLGGLNGNELLVMLPQEKAVGSVAMSLLGEQGDLGVLVFSSRDPQHYSAGQGTQFLQELSILLPGLLERWVERL